MLPGHVVRELVENDRVIGGLTPRCSERAVALYRTFVGATSCQQRAHRRDVQAHRKLFRDVNIAFANELSMICDKLGIDVWGADPLGQPPSARQDPAAGAGVGGHCIAVDPWFIVDKTPEEASADPHPAREVNDSKPEWLISKVREAVARSGRPPTT